MLIIITTNQFQIVIGKDIWYTMWDVDSYTTSKMVWRWLILLNTIDIVFKTMFVISSMKEHFLFVLIILTFDIVYF